MAKNWTMKEATQAIVNGDKEAILDIGRRYPILLNNITGAINGNTDAFLEIINALPDYDTANKVNKKMKDAIEGVTEETEDAEEEEAKKPAKKSAKKAKEDDEEEEAENDYSSMDAKSLFKLCKERGIKAEMKKPVKYYVGLLEKADAEADTDDEWDDEDAEEEVEKKPAKKAKGRPAKKAKEEEDDDEDDEWDI